MHDREEWEQIDKKIESLVKAIITKLKTSHSKFEDPDFGPSDEDEYGAVSFYGPAAAVPDPAGSKYPPPCALKWERPIYADDKFDNSEEDKEIDDGDDESDDEFGIQAHSGQDGEVNTQSFCIKIL